eukprot:TRINITY_DN6879_c0_g3_i1.p1 TRINITY_DN6879_c0_g3~~TRINITY_DN6879_c0_g3_i1.p1  ORF type:complete len:133 (-),score=17.90 TRINITY_DN6879_c0_g3_i1:133-531(-)
MLIMTTNHIERLDPALIRPGRVDKKILFPLASRTQMENLFLNFYPTNKKEAKAFAEALPAEKISMAAIQAHFLDRKDKPEAALRDVLLLEKQHESYISYSLPKAIDILPEEKDESPSSTTAGEKPRRRRKDE